MATACNAPPPNSPSVEALFPTGSGPENRFATKSSLCSLAASPLTVTGGLRQFFCQLFADPNNIENLITREFLIREGPYRDDDNPSAFLIEDMARFRPEVMGQKPAILVRENDWEWQKIGIGNRAGGDVRTGQEFFEGLWVGSHTIFVISGNPSQARQVAMECTRALLHFAIQLLDVLQLAQLCVPLKLGAVSTVKELPGQYACVLDIAYRAGEKWVTEVEAPRLDRIIMQATTN